MSIVYALLTALSWGLGDYCGGRSARRASSYSVTVVAHAVGLAGLTVVALIIGADHFRWSDMGWGALGGVAGCLGIVLLYRCLAEGPMSILSPVGATVAAVVPVVVGLATGERPGAWALVGVAAALVAIVLVSRAGPKGHARPAMVVLAVLSGLGFGGFFVFISRVGSGAGLWPLVIGRIVSVAVAVIIVRLARVPLVVPRPVMALAALTGVLDVTANVTYLLATHGGLLALVAVIAALYPASTVAMALVVDKERLTRAQVGGLLAAGAAVALITIAS